MSTHSYESWYKLGLYAGFVVVSTVMNLLLAFPFMWFWNHVCGGVFKFPMLDWSESFCLMCLLSVFCGKFSIHSKN